jgi:hypothetical protein
VIPSRSTVSNQSGWSRAIAESAATDSSSAANPISRSKSLIRASSPSRSPGDHLPRRQHCRRTDPDPRVSTSRHRAEGLGTDSCRLLGEVNIASRSWSAKAAGGSIEDDVIVARASGSRCRCSRAAAASSPSPQATPPRVSDRPPDCRARPLRPATARHRQVGPAVHRAFHPMLNCATERNMYLPYLAATKARTSLGQCKVCWPSSKTP